MHRVRFSGFVIRTNGGSASVFIMDKKLICIPKLVQAELRSKQGTSIPSSAAIVAASAGDTLSGAEQPEITSPASSGLIPALARAIRAASAPVRALLNWLASYAARGSEFFVLFMYSRSRTV